MSVFQNILEMLNSVGIPRAVETKTGSRVVVRTKHTDQVANVVLQTHIPNRFLAEISSSTHHQRSGDLPQSSDTQQPSNQDELDIHHVHITEVAAPHIHSPLHQSVQMIQLQSHTHALGVTPAHEHLSVPEQRSAAGANDSHPEGEQNSCVSQSHVSAARGGAQPNSSQRATASPRPPALSSDEIHSKAQSMARSRMEKAKRQLQGRIQQAISLFGSQEISVPQVKIKQVVFCFMHFDSTEKCCTACIANQ